MNVLVIGCTGTVGSHMITRLTGEGATVRCMTRSVEKARALPKGVVGQIADLDDPETLPAAFDGMDAVFLLVGVGEKETRQGLAAVSAAQAASVKKIVYLSVFMPKGSDVIPHFASKLPVEKAIRESGISYTILRPNNFFQNDLRVEKALMEYGLYPLPIGAIGLNRVDVRDVADCAVAALTRREHEGRIYGVHGPDTLTGNDIARIYSRYVGRDVRYGGNDLDAWEQQVRNVLPAWQVRDLRVMYRFFQDHGMVANASDLGGTRRILGREPRTFDDFAREIAAAWKSAEIRAA